MEDFKSLVESYNKEQVDEMISILKKRLRMITQSEKTRNIGDYNSYIRLTRHANVSPLLKEIDLAWRKEKCGLITVDERERILDALIKKLEVESEATQQVIDLKLSKLEDILKLQGSSDTYIQHSKLCKLRALGIINEEEERTRISNLYK